MPQKITHDNGIIMTKKSLLIVNTGNSKGKTTAAFGQALRSAGQGMRVCIIQFIKGNQQTGEAKAVRKNLADHLELHTPGSGFTWQQDQQRLTKDGNWPKIKSAALITT